MCYLLSNQRLNSMEVPLKCHMLQAANEKQAGFPPANEKRAKWQPVGPFDVTVRAGSAHRGWFTVQRRTLPPPSRTMVKPLQPPIMRPPLFAGKLSPLPLSSALLPGLVSLRPPSGARVGNPDLSCDTPDYPSPTSLLRHTPSCEDGRRKQEDSRRHGRPLHADVQH